MHKVPTIISMRVQTQARTWKQKQMNKPDPERSTNTTSDLIPEEATVPRPWALGQSACALKDTSKPWTD